MAILPGGGTRGNRGRLRGVCLQERTWGHLKLGGLEWFIYPIVAPKTRQIPYRIAAFPCCIAAKIGCRLRFPRMLNEFSLIREYFSRPSRRVKNVVLGGRRRLRIAHARAGENARGFDRHARRRAAFLRGRGARRARPQDARREPVGPRRDGRGAARCTLALALPAIDAAWLEAFSAGLFRARRPVGAAS